MSEKVKKSPNLGILMVILGILLVATSILLWLVNRQESNEAGEQAAQALPKVQEYIFEKAQENSEIPLESQPHVNPYEQAAVEKSQELTVVEIDGYDYIGFISIPTLGVELPVMSTWSYPQLRIAPCRHMGSSKSDDLVIAAHNYATHFGNIKDLQIGDLVQFVDMDGSVNSYQVVSVGVIPPTAIEEVQDEALDLVLYTCTYGGQYRVMVGCQRTEITENADFG